MESNVKQLTVLGILAVATALVAADVADARRLSGGRSLGAQRQAAPPAQSPAPSAPAASPAGASTSNAAAGTPPGAGPASNPVMAPPAGGPNARPAAATQGAANTAGAAQAASGRSRWLGPIAGLAAGLGLAALASYLGFSEELASVLLIALFVVAAIALLRFAFGRRAPARAAMPYAGAGAGLGSTPGGYETQVPPRTARVEPAYGGVPAMGAAPHVPAGFDAAGFAREAKRQFLAVQAAHDRHDTKALADVMTPELLRELTREMDLSGAARPTEIVEVDAEVIDVATEGRNHWVSVRFSGTAREGGVLEPFDEVWNLVKPVDGSAGWRVAGIQQQVVPS
ncbi:MAG: hypothetical protein AMXMBFR42_17730 [Burkholderiales bacterium]